VNEQDRELFMLLGSVGIQISNIATGLIYHTLGHDEQVAFSNHLLILAEGFRHQALQIPIVVKENPA
jgi:hypothetical protein